MIEILDSNGLADALWALRAVPDEQAAERDRLARLYACACVRKVWHLLTERSRTAVEVSERYAVGAATQDELNAAAADAAYSADDAYSAYAAARAAYSADDADAAAYSAAAYSAAAAVAAADAAYSADDAYSAARDAQAAKFREMFGPVRVPVRVIDVGILELIEDDPYRTDCPAAVQLYIDPAGRWARLKTYSPGQAVDFDVWHHRHITISVHTRGGPVDGPALVDWLRDDEGQELLSRICDGHSVEWDGNNHVGRCKDDAADAYNELSMELDDADALPEPAGLWDVCNWLGGVGRDAVREEYGITADTTEYELDAIAKRIDEEAANENVVLYGTWEYVVQLREDAAEEEEDE